MAEAKKGFKARVESEMAAGEHQSNHESFNTPQPHSCRYPAGGDNLSEMKAAFSQEERAIEHEIDHTVHTFSGALPSNLRPTTFEHTPDVLTLNPSPYPASVDVCYNFLSQ